jgi:hypothetical protein
MRAAMAQIKQPPPTNKQFDFFFLLQIKTCSRPQIKRLTNYKK